MKKAKKKAKKKTLSQLKKSAWGLYSELLRRASADDNGTVVCVSCGESLPWKMAQSGHFVPKVHGLAYWFEPNNVNCQCTKCNMFQTDFAKIGYTLYMLRVFGLVEVNRLLSLPAKKYVRVDYERMIAKYSRELELYKSE